MADPADIFSRTRFIAGELSAAILGAGTRSIGIERARTECDLRNMERNCLEMGRLLGQAVELQAVLARALAQEPRSDVVDMRGVHIGGRNA